MPAVKHLQEKQLSLFMTPDQLHKEVRPSDFPADPPEAAAKGWAKKLDYAQDPAGATNWKGDPVHGAGTYDSIAAEGIRTPVEIDHHIDPETGEGVDVLGDGHHRVAVATARAKQGQETYIPVTYGGHEALNSTKPKVVGQLSPEAVQRMMDNR